MQNQAQGPQVPDICPPITQTPVFSADFRRFAEAFPDFAEDYLYPDQTRPESCPRTPPAPAPNGFCADFSPENSGVGRKPFRKKLD